MIYDLIGQDMAVLALKPSQKREEEEAKMGLCDIVTVVVVVVAFVAVADPPSSCYPDLI